MENAYKRTGNRISLLPIAQYCGLAPRLAAQHGAGRAAAVSSAAHALWSGGGDADKRVALLSEMERAECLSWQRPATIVVPAGAETITLDYDSAEKEIPVGLDEWGLYVDPETATDHDPCLTAGTLDFAWVREVNGQTVAYVADLKRTRFAIPDGVASLQLHAYARAYALRVGARFYTVGYWIIVDAEWVWSSEMIDLHSDRAAQLWESISFAAQNTGGEGSTGPHCAGCYERLHCPEYLLPAALTDTWLAPLADGGTLTPESAPVLVRQVEALKKLLERAEDTLKTYARDNPVVDGSKVWAPSAVRGREYINVTEARAVLGEAVEAVVRRTKDSERFAWKKIGTKGKKGK